MTAERDWADDEATLLASFVERLYPSDGPTSRHHLAAALRRERAHGYEQGRLDALTEVLRSAGLCEPLDAGSDAEGT